MSKPTATATRERPILFSAPMVNAILADRKTQTRRILKQPRRKDGAQLLPELLRSIGVGSACPYGAVGDQLWVRESFLPCRNTGQHPVPIGLASYVCFRDGSQKFYGDGSYYQEPPRDGPFNWPSNAVWRPSIHMPRWASRITLEITEVRVERLQAITDEDAIAEGARRFDSIPLDPMHEFDPEHAARWSMLEPATTGQCLSSSRWAFANLWNQINRDRSWGTDPWVWAITFKRIENTGEYP